jgi:hypothetical protein
MLSEVRAGINSRNIAISRDGKHIAIANYLPRALVMLSTDDLSVEKIFEAKDKKGNSSRVSAVYQAPPRDSFIAALKDVPEIWEIATDPNAPPVYPGLVHSHEKGMIEALQSSQGLFALRRIEIPEPLDDFFFDPPYRNLVGSAREGKAIVVNLTVGRDIKQLAFPGLPHLGSGISWNWNGRPVMATPHLKEGKISVLDMQDWSLIKVIDTPGPGFFMRSHENSPYAWTDAMMGTKKDTMSVIDKRTLEVVRTATSRCCRHSVSIPDFPIWCWTAPPSSRANSALRWTRRPSSYWPMARGGIRLHAKPPSRLLALSNVVQSFEASASLCWRSGLSWMRLWH